MPNESLTFREIRVVDFPNVALLIERANAQRDHIPLPSSITDLDAVGNIRKKLDRHGAWAELATIDQHVAGICLGYPASEARDLPLEYADGEYISLLMVEPAHWGQRIATSLIDRAAERLRQRNKQQLLLLTRESENSRARGLYEHVGFTLTGDTRPSKYGVQVLYLMNL